MEPASKQAGMLQTTSGSFFLLVNLSIHASLAVPVSAGDPKRPQGDDSGLFSGSRHPMSQLAGDVPGLSGTLYGRSG